MGFHTWVWYILVIFIPSAPRSIPSSSPSPNLSLFNPMESCFCCLYTHGCWAIHRCVVAPPPPWTTPLKLLSSRSYQLPIASQMGWGLKAFPFQSGTSPNLDLAQENSSCCGFMGPVRFRRCSWSGPPWPLALRVFLPPFLRGPDSWGGGGCHS